MVNLSFGQIQSALLSFVHSHHAAAPRVLDRLGLPDSVTLSITLISDYLSSISALVNRTFIANIIEIFNARNKKIDVVLRPGDVYLRDTSFLTPSVRYSP